MVLTMRARLHYALRAMTGKFVEIAIRGGVDAGELLGVLAEGDALGGWEDDGVLRIYWPEDRWGPRVREELACALSALGAGAADVSVRILQDRDWNESWTASLQPILVGPRVRIRQSWHAADPLFRGIELVVDPRRAFGTGHHATTRMVLEWLQACILGGERVLDVGTGSGILAMAALRLGACSALGVDTDPVAIDCARDYRILNGFGSEMQLRVGSFEDLEPGAFDVVVANLDIRTLPALCRALPRLLRAEGRACLSGLQEQDLEEVSEALAEAGFEITGRRGQEEWLAIEARRRV